MTDWLWGRCVTAMLATALVSACADEGGPNEIPSPGDAGSAVLGAAGGSVQATLAGGGALELTVPAGALQDTVTITITPLTPAAGEYAAFQVTPGGLEFATPASFEARLPAGTTLDPSATFVFDVGTLHVPFAAVVDPVRGRVTVSIARLGASEIAAAPASAPQRASRVGPAATGSVASVDYQERAAILTSFAAAMQTDGSFSNAEDFLTVLESIVTEYPDEARADATNPPAMDVERRVVCDQYTFERSALQSYADAGGLHGLRERIRQVVRWGDAAAAFGRFAGLIGVAGCAPPVPNPVDEIGTKLATFLPLVEREIELLDPVVSTTVILRDRMSPLLNLQANFLRYPPLQAYADTISAFVDTTLTMLRDVGYERCSGFGSQIMQRELIFEALGDELILGALPYPVGKVQEDVQLCGLGITWRSRDASGTTLNTGTLGAGSAPGPSVRDSVSLSSGQTLEFAGTAGPLKCSSGANDGGGLVIRARAGVRPPLSIASLAAHPVGYAFPVSVSASALRTYAGLQTGDVGFATVELQRAGDFCELDFNLHSHTEVLTVLVRLADAVEITTASLPGGTVGAPYTAQLNATGGTGSFTWNLASGALPPGLVLGGSTGLISGTPTTEGTATFTVKAGSAQDSATRVLSIAVAAPPDPPIVITTTSLPIGHVGQAYFGPVSFSGGGSGTPIYSLSSGILPPGLTIGTGGILGTPLGTDTVSIGVRVTVGTQSATKSLLLMIEGAPLRIVTTSIAFNLPDLRFTTSIPGSQTLSAAGGTGVYTWSVLSGNLPTGTSLNPLTGVISGNVTAAGSPILSIRVSDGQATFDSSVSVVYFCCFF